MVFRAMPRVWGVPFKVLVWLVLLLGGRVGIGKGVGR